MTEAPRPDAPSRPCAICGRPVVTRGTRFCSDRCAQVDLGRWLRGNYAIAVQDDEKDADDRD